MLGRVDDLQQLGSTVPVESGAELSSAKRGIIAF